MTTSKSNDVVKVSRGRMSNSDTRFILKNKDTMSAAQIAKQIGKTEEMVAKFIDKHELKPETATAVELVNNFEDSDLYKRLSLQFTKVELRFFETEYRKMISQFANDITPSEDNDVVSVVTFEILKSRCLAEHKNAIDRLNQLQIQIDAIEKQYRGQDMPDTVKEAYASLQNSVVGANKFMGEVNEDFIKLTNQQQNIQKNLKMTRDQRINKVETKATFIDLIKEFKKLERQDKESRYAELVKKATLREKRKLESPHTYVDGQTDIPLLTAESFEDDTVSEEE